MKEAAGEANMTVITIILIGVIAAVAIPMVNTAMNNAKDKANCNAAGGYVEGTQCCMKPGDCKALSGYGSTTGA